MAIIGSIFIAAAALIHVWIFCLESVIWASPNVWKRFGLRSQDEADAVRPMAYNQGFYNLYLAAGAAIGLVLHWTTLADVGIGIIFFSAICMMLAAIVLLTTGRVYLRASLIQGVLPLIGLTLLAISYA